MATANIIDQEDDLIQQLVEEDNHKKEIEDSNIINHFPLGFFKSFTVKASVLNYKLAMYWIPIVVWFLIMTSVSNYVLFGGVIDNMT